jgi:Acyl-protein synthetase, LuxE
VSFEALLRQPPHGVAHQRRRALLLPELNVLSEMHFESCEPYKRIINGIWGGKASAAKIEDLPFLPVSIFKTQTLQSVSSANIRLTLTSSGTTGQVVSKVMVDSETSLRQQSALVNSLAHVLGKKRLPMLVIDTQDVYRNPAMMNARGAGVLGMMRFGRDHAFALRPDLSPDFEAVKVFLKTLNGAPFFMFGFTYLVWSRFFEAFQNENLDLSQGILIHSGGWKKMAEKSVDNAIFRKQFAKKFSLQRIYNFYGMVEQIGSIFLEGPRDLLYPPNFSDVIIRDPQTWQPVPVGTPGLIQVLSLVPKSYPGNSLLTEDMGVIEEIDPSIDGWMGPGLRVIGRVPKAELRGCSDVVASYAA